MGSLQVLDRSGDTKLIWSSENDAEVENARRTFDDLRAKGYWGYSVTGKGDKGTKLDRFDPSAEKIIMAPQMAGG